MIRPVDLPVLITRSAEIRTDGNLAAKHNAAQQQFANVMKQSAQQETQTVVKNHRGEQNNVDKDGRGNGAGGGSKKKKQNQDDEEQGQATGIKKSSTSMFDLSI